MNWQILTLSPWKLRVYSPENWLFIKCSKMAQQVQESVVSLRMFSQRQFMPCRQPTSGWQQAQLRSTYVSCTRRPYSHPSDLLASRPMIQLFQVQRGTSTIIRWQTSLVKGEQAMSRYSFRRSRPDRVLSPTSTLPSTLSFTFWLTCLLMSSSSTSPQPTSKYGSTFMRQQEKRWVELLRRVQLASWRILRVSWLEVSLLVDMSLWVQWYSISLRHCSRGRLFSRARSAMNPNMNDSGSYSLPMQEFSSYSIQYTLASWVAFSRLSSLELALLRPPHIYRLKSCLRPILPAGWAGGAFPLSLMLLRCVRIYSHSYLLVQNQVCLPSYVISSWCLCLTLEAMQRRLQRMVWLSLISTATANMYLRMVASSLNLTLLSLIQVWRPDLRRPMKYWVHLTSSSISPLASSNCCSSFYRLLRLVKKEMNWSTTCFWCSSPSPHPVAPSPSVSSSMLALPSLSLTSSLMLIDRVSLLAARVAYSCSDSSTAALPTSRFTSRTVPIWARMVKAHLLELRESALASSSWYCSLISRHLWLQRSISDCTTVLSISFYEMDLVRDSSLTVQFLLSSFSSDELVSMLYMICSDSRRASLWLAVWVWLQRTRGSTTSSFILPWMLASFLASSCRMSITYFPRNIIASSSVSSTRNCLKNRRQAFRMSVLMVPSRAAMLSAKVRTQRVRVQLWVRRLLSVECSSMPYYSSHSAIYIYAQPMRYSPPSNIVRLPQKRHIPSICYLICVTA